MSSGAMVKSLFVVFISILLLSVIGLALRGTVVGKMCALTDGYDVTLDNGSTETFASAGIDCQTNGLLYTWGLIITALGSIIGMIFVGVSQFKKGA